jgi:hypothetical protein
MRRRLLLLVAVALALTAASVPLAVATPPQDVEITIDETFNTTPPFVTGDITATGGVFGEEESGTLASVAFKPVGFPMKFPSPDHIFVYTATDEYTFGDDTFLISFEASCNFVGFDVGEGRVILACAGNWRANGGTGDYDRLKGTGTFAETQELDPYTGAGEGFITLVGNMHVD